MDNLKYVNDNFGHDMGDRLIIKAGEMFREFKWIGGIVSRISGDEFAVYLHGFSSKEEARDIIAKQFKKHRNYHIVTPGGTTQKIRYSTGISWYPSDSDNVTDLLKLADYAMYEAKHNRKGTIFEFNSKSYNENAYLLENSESINRLLDDGLIHFAFQPIVDLRTAEVFAYEALMRPVQKEFKSPVEIIKVATAQSKLGQLEKLVMFTAFQAINSNIDKIGGRTVFINSIPSQTIPESSFYFLSQQYSRFFGQIVLEITEAENNDPAQLKSKIALTKNFGLKIAVDDYGSGYSNEVRVLAMEPDIVKIDIEIVRGIHSDKDKQKLVRNIVSFCHPKGISLIAEGVETPEDLKKLKELEIDYVQGYFTGRPSFGILDVDEEAKAYILQLIKE